MKISELTTEEVANFIRVDDPDETELSGLMAAAKNYIKTYTGQTDEFIDTQEDLTYVYLALIGEMYERRQRQLDKATQPNQTFVEILNLYCINQIPEGDTDD